MQDFVKFNSNDDIQNFFPQICQFIQIVSVKKM